MTSEQAYLHFINKVNKNATTDEIVVDKPRFVMIINEAQNKFFEWVLENKNDDTVRYISKFIKSKKLQRVIQTSTYDEFGVPDDMFFPASVKIISGEKELTFNEVSPEESEILYNNSLFRPNLEFGETFGFFTKNGVRIYKYGFDIDEVVLTYYKKPRYIDIEGYENENGQLSATVNPEWDDNAMYHILDVAVKEFDMNNGELDKVQFDLQKQNIKP